ncbi:MAG: cupin domain-containing protein, partial [Sandarakinorhabdus sp.]|nr:cupin domain-containing protein [Sandarakinorhabdus sp.]
MIRSFKTIALVTGLLLATLTGAAFAQSTGLTRTVVTKADVSVADREAIIARVDIA